MLQADADIALDRVEGFIKGFWWILPNVGIALVVFLIIWGIALAIGAAIGRLFRRRNRPDLAVLLAGFARWFIIALGFLVVAAIVFPSVKPADILATLGIGSIAIGFAFKDILQNWLSGLLILLRQPFRQGDQIVVGEHEGTVERIKSRATFITTYDGRRVIIPNSDVYTRAVTVNTAFDKRRSEYEVGIGYGDQVGDACAAIVEALRSLPEVCQEPEPQALPWALASSSVNIRALWWCDSSMANVITTRGRAIRAIKEALDRAGIDMPFNTQVLLFHDQTEDADGHRGRQREGWPQDRPARAPLRKGAGL